jgi:hypothetical protein
MLKNNKGGTVVTVPTPKTSCTLNSSRIRSKVKALIVSLAMRDLIPAGLAYFLIQQGGMTHE